MRKRLRKYLCFMISVSMIFSMFPALQADGAGVVEQAQIVSPDVPVLNGLVQKDGYYVYYVDGKMVKDTWKTVKEKEYYFNKSGRCTKIYDKNTGKCKIYGNGKMIAVKNDLCRLRNGKLYYFNAKGIRVAKKGWTKASAKKYIQVKASGYVIAKIENTKGLWKYYTYNYKTNKWKKQKNVWKSVDGSRYYFNKSGNCTKIYNTKTEKCYQYEKGKMRAVKKDICRLNNGKLYYFNAKGVRVTKKGWKKASSKMYFQLGKSGSVNAKIQNTKGIWRYYKYDYGKNKWMRQKKVWITVDKKQYYFASSGKCTRMYDTVTRKCYDYKNGGRKLIKNDVREVNGKEYYFGADGIRVKEAGMYLTSGSKLVYANGNGTVTKKISGQIFTYVVANVNRKIASCRVKDGVYMCYYNGGSEPRRMIDTSRPMVALTYDDGPSQYTQEILSVLGQYNSVATFFVVGSCVPRYPEAVRSAYQMGCQIGNHTYSHLTLTSAGVSAIQSQISATNNNVQNIIGVSPVIMRPPGGAQNATVRSAVGMPVILWSIDTLDWKTRNAASTQAAVLNKVRDGDIVLMHDLYSQTAAASRVIIPELVGRGYQLVTVSELSDCRGGMASGGVYSAFR